METSESNDRNLLDKFLAFWKRITFYRITVWISYAILTYWCVVNLIPVSGRYYSTETVISLDNKPPNVFNFPGITVCAPGIFSPKQLADLFPDFKLLYEEFLKTSPKWQMKMDRMFPQQLQERIDGYAKYETIALTKFPVAEIIANYSLKLDDLVDWCKFRPFNMRTIYHDQVNITPVDCGELKPVLESIYEGRKCFTFFSNIFNIKSDFKNVSDELDQLYDMYGYDDEKVIDIFLEMIENNSKNDLANLLTLNLVYIKRMIYYLNPDILLQIKMDSSWYYIGNWTVLMTVHPTNTVPNKREFDFFTVSKNSYCDVSFSKKMVHLNKLTRLNQLFPNCMDPIKEGYIGQFQTYDECLNYCIMNAIYNKYQCATYFIPLTRRMFMNPLTKFMFICNHTDEKLTRGLYNTFMDAKDHGCEMCIPECSQSMYSIVRKNQCGELFEQNDENDDDDDNIVVTNDNFDFQNKPAGQYSAGKSYRYIGNSTVSINISPRLCRVIIHKPGLTEEEALGLIGGHLGIWLGLSIYCFVYFAAYFWFKFFLWVLRCCIGNRRFNLYWKLP